MLSSISMLHWIMKYIILFISNETSFHMPEIVFGWPQGPRHINDGETIGEKMTWVCRKSVVRPSWVVGHCHGCCFFHTRSSHNSRDSFVGSSCVRLQNITYPSYIPLKNENMLCNTNATLSHDRRAMFCEPITKYKIRETIMKQSLSFWICKYFNALLKFKPNMSSSR